MVDKTREEKRAGLIDTAYSVFRRQGIKKTTLDDISAAAGIATTSLYYYFPNKLALLRAVFGMLIGRTLEEMEAAVAASSTPEEKLVATWRVLFSAVKSSGLMLNQSGNQKTSVLATIGDLINDFERRYKESVRRIITDGIERGIFRVDDIDLAVTVLSSGAIGLITNVVGEDEYDVIEGRIEKVGGLLMNGLRRR